MMQTVQQSINTRSDLDVSFISQRILVMPCPSEGLESAYRASSNHIEDVRAFVEQRFQPSKISVYNLGTKCPRLPPPVRTVECGALYHPLTLTHMYGIAEDMYGFLHADPKNVIILQSSDEAKSATMLCTLMLYAKLVREPEDAMQMFAVKRVPPNMKPSEVRYTYYISDVLRGHLPHYKPITLVSVNMSVCPRMTKARDGCRPYIEISVNDRIAVNTLLEYERMRVYHASESKINIPLNITLCGDITITIYHARRSIVGQQQGLKICQMQFHSGFIPEEETLLLYHRNELDEVLLDQVPENFSLSLSVFIGDDERTPSTKAPWCTTVKDRSPKVLFASQLEFEENVDNFITKGSCRKAPPPPRPAPPGVAPPQPFKTATPDPFATVIPEPPSTTADPPTTEFDFLRLNSESTSPPKPPLKEPSFDLLGGFESNFQDPYPDLVGSALNRPQPSKSACDLDDIFSSFADTSSMPTITPNKSSNDLNFNQPPPPTFDPFADLGTTQPDDIFTTTSTASTPNHQTRSNKPDYSRSHFQDPQQGQQKGGKPADIFGDILGSQGYSFGKANQGPKSINEMRKVELAQTMDPEKLKVQEWVR